MLLALLKHATFPSYETVQIIGLAVLSVGTFLAILALSARRRYTAWRNPPDLKNIGLVGSSNLADQFDQAYSQSDSSTEDEVTRIKALYIHPIKSCRPIEVTQARLTKIGFAYDRFFALALSRDNGEWELLSQRTKPKMALVQQELWLPDRHKIKEGGSYSALVRAEGCVIISFPDPEPITLMKGLGIWLATGSFTAHSTVTFRIPLLPERTCDYEAGLPMRSFKLHRRIARGLDYSEIAEVAAAMPKLKKFLKISQRQDLMLLRCNDEMLTRTDINLAPLKHIGKPAMIGYVDQQPVHIINMSSVRDVSTLLPEENQPLDARRFRANIYLEGPPAYAEESWKRFRIRRSSESRSISEKNKALTLSVVCRTARCPMPNVIPEKGIFEEENPPEGRTKGKAQPSSTLIEHRQVEDTNPAALGYLGMHCVPEDSSLEDASDDDLETWIRVGDEIEVIETGTHVYGSTRDDY